MSTPRDAENRGEHYVYRCFTERGELLYVGCTNDVPERMWHLLHPCNRGKLPNGMLRRYMATHTATEYPSRLAARAAEREAIRTEAPLLNRQHNPKRFRKATGGRYELVAPVHPLTEEAFGDIEQASA
jgi:predicted GIY-YIG superfamily endonuclease